MKIRLLWFADLRDGDREKVFRRAQDHGLFADLQRAVVVHGGDRNREDASARLKLLADELAYLHPVIDEDK